MRGVRDDHFVLLVKKECYDVRKTFFLVLLQVETQCTQWIMSRDDITQVIYKNLTSLISKVTEKVIKGGTEYCC